MNGNSDFGDLLRAFANEGVRYLIVGGYAMIHHTEPRFTKDLDLWVDRKKRNAERVYRALSRFGAPLEDVSEADFMNPSVIFQVGVEPNRVDIIMSVLGLSFDSAWRRRVRGTYDGMPIPVLSKADLVKNKAALNRPRDQLDVLALKPPRQKHKSKKPRS